MCLKREYMSLVPCISCKNFIIHFGRDAKMLQYLFYVRALTFHLRDFWMRVATMANSRTTEAAEKRA